MNIAEKIYKEASKLPEHLAKEVLDFIEYIEKIQPSGTGDTEPERSSGSGYEQYLG